MAASMTAIFSLKSWKMREIKSVAADAEETLPATNGRSNGQS